MKMNKDVRKKLSILEKKIKYKFKRENYLVVGLTHKSCITGFDENSYEKHNERMEFLGDSVLGFVVTDNIFKKLPTTLKEGELSDIRSHLVCKSTLASVARGFNLHEYLFLGKGISKEEVYENDSVLENSVEALIGAIYLDGGLKNAIKFIKTFVLPPEGELMQKMEKDSKSKLQELLQVRGDSLIEYKLKRTLGPDHDKVFETEVFNKGELLGSGMGKSKKLAEQNAATEALKKLGELDEK